MATQPPDLSLMELCAWKLLSCDTNWESGGPLAGQHSWLNRSQLGAELLLLPLLDGMRRFTPARFDYRQMPDQPVRVTAAAIRQVALFRGACVPRLDLLPSNTAPSLGDEPYPGAQQELLTALLNLTPASLYLYEGLALEPKLDTYIVHLRRLASLLHTLDIGAHYPDLIKADHRISFNRVTCLRARLPAHPDSNPLADLDVRFICANLVSLDLAGSGITAAQLLAAPQMPALRCLGLRRCVALFLADSEDITVAELLETYNFDTEVAARLDELSESDASGLDALCEKFPLLEVLDIGLPHNDPLPDAETLLFPFADAADRLRRLLQRLPRLRRLDLSFTSLADAAPALSAELAAFDYLGLFGAASRLDGFDGADRVGSERSLAGFSCLLREFARDPQAATIVLRSLFQFLRLPAQPGPDNSAACGLRLLHRLLDIMEDFVWADEKLEALFLQASASIYYLIRSYLQARPAGLFDTVCRCLDVIATSIYRWRADPLTRRNFLLSLFLLLNNEIEAAIMSCSRVKLLRSLLFVLDQSCEEEEPESIRYVLAVINYLAISFDEPERQFVGCECRLVTRALQFIQNCLNPPRRIAGAPQAQCLSSAWSILWNITDESEPNCAAFMQSGGLQCLVDCHRVHSTSPDASQELMRNVLGLLGNVSEVPSLAADLLTGESREIADILLVYLSRWTADNVEAAYNAAGIVAHCLHSRREKELTKVERELDAKVSEVIRNWPTSNLSRQINYRSFQPILRLLRCRRSRASYAWGTWALMSMCKHLPDKYVPLLASEGGHAVLLEFVQEVGNDIEAVKWARETLEMLEKRQARDASA
ncbi:hypothetical protein BOX15_Mlig032513g2 [Macrostomum lignano]|uniref:Protein zer-1 homolog-like C-terminal domain-containing protein n=2 Tax=Macrostomum lignano TaxID=282301 RepID=A0A267E5G9_9PLAT|nr:hypothetical protein BOX15_Mlig032513g2 [Macrostomum lignano]